MNKQLFTIIITIIAWVLNAHVTPLYAQNDTTNTTTPTTTINDTPTTTTEDYSIESIEEDMDELKMQMVDVKLHVMLYMEQLESLASQDMKLTVGSNITLAKTVYLYAKKVKNFQKELSYYDSSWDTYYQSQQVVIAEDTALLAMTTKMQVLRESLDETISAHQQRLDQLKALSDMERIMQGKYSAYKDMESKANMLSLTPKTADKLEQLKAKEQLTFTSLQQAYDKMKAAEDALPMLKKRAQLLEQQFVEITTMSKKIQEAEYKPWLKRFQDELIGLGCIAMILMLFNMIIAKIKAAKQEYNNAKKLKDIVKKQEEQYPTI